MVEMVVMRMMMKKRLARAVCLSTISGFQGAPRSLKSFYTSPSSLSTLSTSSFTPCTGARGLPRGAPLQLSCAVVGGIATCPAHRFLLHRSFVRFRSQVYGKRRGHHRRFFPGDLGGKYGKTARWTRKAAENDYISDVNEDRWHRDFGLSAGFEIFGFLKIWWKNDGRGFAPQPPLDDPKGIGILWISGTFPTSSS